MAKVAGIIGAKAVIKRLNRVTKYLEGTVQVGMTEAGFLLQRKSMEIVPKQLVNLSGSSYSRNIGGRGFRVDIVVGYTSPYAVYVHEDLEAAHGEAFNIKHAREIAAASGTPRGTAEGGMFKRGKNEQAKFLEKPARDNRKAMLMMIGNKAKIV